MADEDTTNPVDGGEPTDAEAKLAAQVTTIGDNPTEEPADEPAAPPAAAPAEEAPPAQADEPTPAAPASAAPAPAEEPAPVASPPPAAPAKPEPPKDFGAAFEELQKRYDDGDIESSEFSKGMRELSREEASYTARVTIWEENQRTAAQQAANSFNEAALAWETANKDFMANPLRAQQMQQALELYAAAEPGLTHEDLLAKAAKAAFEAFNWTPAATTAAQDAADAIARATAARAPKPVPATLGTAPAAAVTQGAGNAAFAELDGKSIGELEDAMAHMSPAQREAYLRASPGSDSTGHEMP